VNRRQAAEGLILPIAVLAVWQAGGRYGIVPHYLSSPAAIVAEFGRQLQPREFFDDVSASLLRAYVGFAPGAAAGIGCGLPSGVFVAIRNFFDPLIALLYPIPKIAFLPVFFLMSLPDRHQHLSRYHGDREQTDLECAEHGGQPRDRVPAGNRSCGAAQHLLRTADRFAACPYGRSRH
jgi:hypothetical protein